MSDKLLAEGQAGVVLVRAMLRYFMRLQQLAELRQGGMSLDGAIEALQPRVFFKQKPILKQHGARWSSHKIADAIALLQIMELDSKRYAEQARIRLADGWLKIAALSGPIRG
jgi:DNA polymerase-3 subunit delta